MLEEKKTISADAQPVHEEYPYNLLTAIVGQTNLVPPEVMTTDRCHVVFINST